MPAADAPPAVVSSLSKWNARPHWPLGRHGLVFAIDPRQWSVKEVRPMSKVFVQAQYAPMSRYPGGPPGLEWLEDEGGWGMPCAARSMAPPLVLRQGGGDRRRGLNSLPRTSLILRSLMQYE
jgi:hypothetical protein